MHRTVLSPWLGRLADPEYPVFAWVEQLLKDSEHLESLRGEMNPQLLEIIKQAAEFRLNDEENSAATAQLGWPEINRQINDPRPIYEASIAKLKALITWLETELKNNLR